MADSFIKTEDIKTIEDARFYIINRFINALGNDEEFAGSVIKNSLRKLGIDGYNGINEENIEEFYNDILGVYEVFHPNEAKDLRRDYKKVVFKIS